MPCGVCAKQVRKVRVIAGKISPHCSQSAVNTAVVMNWKDIFCLSISRLAEFCKIFWQQSPPPLNGIHDRVRNAKKFCAVWEYTMVWLKSAIIFAVQLYLVIMHLPALSCWRHAVFRLSSHVWSYSESCERNILQTSCRHLTKFTTSVHHGTKMNWLDFEVKRSEVKVTKRPNVVKNATFWQRQVYRSAVCYWMPSSLC